MITLLQRIVIYIVILAAIYIFVKISQLEFNGRKVISLKYRLLLSIFFPLVLIIILLLSSFLIALVIAIILAVFLYSLFYRYKNRKFKEKHHKKPGLRFKIFFK